MSLNFIDPRDILLAMAHRVGEPDANGCMMWLGNISPNGYGRVRIGTRTFSAHRAAWVARNGPLDDGLDACHHCDNRWCCNPEHVFPGTRRINMLDASNKRRLHAQISPQTLARADQHGKSKLTLAQIEAIKVRKAAGTHAKVLAAEYGVHKCTIERAVAGRSRRPPRALQSLRAEE